MNCQICQAEIERPTTLDDSKCDECGSVFEVTNEGPSLKIDDRVRDAVRFAVKTMHPTYELTLCSGTPPYNKDMKTTMVTLMPLAVPSVYAFLNRLQAEGVASIHCVNEPTPANVIVIDETDEEEDE